jgi:ABC-2 type transport system permease protein
MITLARIELRKLLTTPAAYVSLAITVVLTALSVGVGVMLAGVSGSPPLGSPANVDKTLSVAALSSMVMLVMGILAMAGEFRHRTIIATYLAEPRRARVLVAKVGVLGAVGTVFGAVTFGLGYGLAVALYAFRGVHHLDVDLTRAWLGAALAGGCYALLGVALGALTRNTVGAVLGGLAWVQIVEVGILQSVWPSVAKWLPTGAGVAVTGPGATPGLLAPGIAALVLVGWAAVLSLLATRISLRRELR